MAANSAAHIPAAMNAGLAAPVGPSSRQTGEGDRQSSKKRKAAEVGLQQRVEYTSTAKAGSMIAGDGQEKNIKKRSGDDREQTEKTVNKTDEKSKTRSHRHRDGRLESHFGARRRIDEKKGEADNNLKSKHLSRRERYKLERQERRQRQKNKKPKEMRTLQESQKKHREFSCSIS